MSPTAYAATTPGMQPSSPTPLCQTDCCANVSDADDASVNGVTFCSHSLKPRTKRCITRAKIIDDGDGDFVTAF